MDLPLRCRPLRTIRPPSPTVSAELQWGELRRGAFGTCARFAGSFSISEWSVLLPSGQLLVLAVCGRSISKWYHFGYQRNAGQGGNSKSFDRVLVVERYSVRRGELQFRFSICKPSNDFSEITTQTRSASETRRSWSYALDLPSVVAL